jgi:hypothetical protein
VKTRPVDCASVLSMVEIISTQGTQMEAPAYFELNFRPNVALVSVVRRFVSEFYERLLGDPDGTSRVALATHELLENAVKYSIDGETTIRIEVALPSEVRRTVRIRLTNRAEARHVAELEEILDGARQAGDADAFYQTVIARSAKRRDRSGLGLARICAEGEMEMSYQVLEGDRVVIDAVTRVGQQGAS